MEKLLKDQPAVTAWSEFSFAQLPIDGQIIPALGLQRQLGSVQPPTTSGQALSGSGQVELGSVTLRQLGKKVGDRVQIGIPGHEQTVVVTGTVTLPSFGVGAADHPSLGRGVMATAATLQAAMGQTGPRPSQSQAIPVLPSAALIDLAPGTTAAQRAALVTRITSANPDGTPGGTYELVSARASTVVNAEQMGGQPLALAVGMAVAAVLSLALTILSLVRRRRGELALLKVLGMTRAQIWAVIAWQTTLTLLIAVLVGGLLGIVGGRLAWHAFADSLGVVPVVEVSVPVLILGLAALVLAGNLLAALPAAVAGPDQARRQPARRVTMARGLGLPPELTLDHRHQVRPAGQAPEHLHRHAELTGCRSYHRLEHAQGRGQSLVPGVGRRQVLDGQLARPAERPVRPGQPGLPLRRLRDHRPGLLRARAVEGRQHRSLDHPGHQPAVRGQQHVPDVLRPSVTGWASAKSRPSISAAGSNPSSPRSLRPNSTVMDTYPAASGVRARTSTACRTPMPRSWASHGP